MSIKITPTAGLLPQTGVMFTIKNGFGFHTLEIMGMGWGFSRINVRVKEKLMSESNAFLNDNYARYFANLRG